VIANGNPMPTIPKITVVIPIKNEAKFIAATIAKILAQDYPPDRLEIIVACGESSDNSFQIVSEMAAEDSRIRLFLNPVGLASAGRNIGVRNGSGDIIIFIDGHTYINNNQLLKNTADIMTKYNLSVLSRPQFLETPDNTVFQQAVALARKSFIGHGLDSTIYTDEDKFVEPTSSGASYRKEIFYEYGLYDERFDACEDVEFNYRLAKAGQKSFTSLKLAVYYYPRDSLVGLFQQMKRYGVGRFRLAQKHPGTLSLSNIIPPLFVAALPLLGLLSIVSDAIYFLFIGLAAAYFLIILAGSINIAARNGLRYLSSLPLIYVAIHFGLGGGFLSELWKTVTGRGIDFSEEKRYF
jgi:glycosyltransferase involved in cell wall biosynthesis